MAEEEKKGHWLWEHALFLPKNSIRGLAFLGTLGFLGYLALKLQGNAQMTIVGGFISVLTTALHYYFKAREEKPKE